jgi:Uma2 family endonuclease
MLKWKENPMSTITGKKLLTAEDFYLLPDPADGSQQELVRGEIFTMTPPGGMHGGACSKADRRIGNFVEEHGLGHVTCNDTGVITERGPDTVRGPDVAFWSKERLPSLPTGYIQVPPDLVVEVLSPGNTSKEIRAKLREYFAMGVRVVWVIAPEDRTLTIYGTLDEARLLHESATVSGGDVLPGFSCRVGDLMP